MPIVIAFSSTESTCALADNSDQVSLRRFYILNNIRPRAYVRQYEITGTFGAATGAVSFALTELLLFQL